VLRRIATVLQQYPNHIQVEGFTDNVPINTYLFPSNWELSAARAASVVHVFMKSGVDPERMSAVGFGEYRPVEANTTAEGRNRNRRVVVVVMADADKRRLIDMQRNRAQP
jgi:chemotaxis protein MotB